MRYLQHQGWISTTANDDLLVWREMLHLTLKLPAAFIHSFFYQHQEDVVHVSARNFQQACVNRHQDPRITTRPDNSAAPVWDLQRNTRQRPLRGFVQSHYRSQHSHYLPYKCSQIIPLVAEAQQRTCRGENITCFIDWQCKQAQSCPCLILFHQIMSNSYLRRQCLPIWTCSFCAGVATQKFACVRSIQGLLLFC